MPLTINDVVLPSSGKEDLRGFERTKAIYANYYRGTFWNGHLLNPESPGFLQDCEAWHGLFTGRMSYNEFCARHEDLAEMPRALDHLVGAGALVGAILPEEVKVVIKVNSSGYSLYGLQGLYEYEEDDKDPFDYDAWDEEERQKALLNPDPE